MKIVDELLKLSKKAYKNNDVPISCIIIKNNKIIARSYNKKVLYNDAFAHAEIECIRKASKKLKTYNLSDCELYSLLYPCKMCMEVIKEARIKKVFYILDNNKIINNKIIVNKLKIDTEKYDNISNYLSGFFNDKR